MVACCDTETGSEVIGDGPDCGRSAERSPESGDATNDRDANNQNDIEPVDVLVPVLSGHRRIGDVRLIWVVGL